MGPDLQRVELRERDLQLADAGARLDPEEVVAAAGAGRPPRSAPSGRKPYDRPVEDPGRVGELRVHRGQRFEPRTVDQAVEVPPAAPVADEVERAVGRPFGLDDRFVRAAGGQHRLAERAVRLERGDPQAAWRPTACPGDPTRARRAASRPATGAGAATKSEPLTRTCGSPPSSGMVTIVLAGSASHAVVLADGVEAAAGEVRSEVGVAPRTGRRDRHRRLGTRIEPVQPAVGELGEDDDPADHDVRTAAVLVDPRCGR